MRIAIFNKMKDKYHLLNEDDYSPIDIKPWRNVSAKIISGLAGILILIYGYTAADTNQYNPLKQIKSFMEERAQKIQLKENVDLNKDNKISVYELNEYCKITKIKPADFIVKNYSNIWSLRLTLEETIEVNEKYEQNK
jgi:hypothetical protein